MSILVSVCVCGSVSVKRWYICLFGRVLGIWNYATNTMMKTHRKLVLRGFHFPLRGLTTSEFNDHIVDCSVAFEWMGAGVSLSV